MPQRSPFGPFVRGLTLSGATLATGLMAGLFYAYAVSVNPGLAESSDAGYVATMNEINTRIQNPLFFAGFFGAVMFPAVALIVHRSPRPLSGRFKFVALGCALYVGGVFAVTVLANVPLNERLAGVAADASAAELARARAAYEGPWNFWNGVRTVFSVAAFLALIGACLVGDGRETRAE